MRNLFTVVLFFICLGTTNCFGSAPPLGGPAIKHVINIGNITVGNVVLTVNSDETTTYLIIEKGENIGSVQIPHEDIPILLGNMYAVAANLDTLVEMSIAKKNTTLIIGDQVGNEPNKAYMALQNGAVFLVIGGEDAMASIHIPDGNVCQNIYNLLASSINPRIGMISFNKNYIFW